jgi:Domain of unknown function (DUF1929)
MPHKHNSISNSSQNIIGPVKHTAIQLRPAIWWLATAALALSACGKVAPTNQNTETTPVIANVPADVGNEFQPDEPATADVSLAAIEDRASQGYWGAPEAWPVTAIHAALMPPSSSNPYSSIVTWGWNVPATPTSIGITKVDRYNRSENTHEIQNASSGTTGDMFGAGQAHADDGSLFVAGGSPPLDANGWGRINNSFRLDLTSPIWKNTPAMKETRWYPTTTKLANGEMLVISGVPNLAEVFQKDGTWRSLETARRDLPLYPWMHVAPDGRVLNSGPQANMAYLNTSGTGTWTDISTARDNLYRDYGNAVMYRQGKLLVIGGGSPAVKTASIVDMATGATTPTGSMTFARRNINSVVLPDGKVLVVGGNIASGNSDGASAYTSELWNPETGQWSLLSSQTQRRDYHSTALLLPSGAVFSAGGFTAPDSDKAEFFLPPSLFNAQGRMRTIYNGTRPWLWNAPKEITYGQAFTVNATGAKAKIVSLIHPGATTHAVDMSQRRVELDFTAQAGGKLGVTAPADRNTAPAGYYMMFVVDENGSASPARWVLLK